MLTSKRVLPDHVSQRDVISRQLTLGEDDHTNRSKPTEVCACVLELLLFVRVVRYLFAANTALPTPPNRKCNRQKNSFQMQNLSYITRHNARVARSAYTMYTYEYNFD